MNALVIFTSDVARLAQFYQRILTGEQMLEPSGDIRVRSNHHEVLVHASHGRSATGEQTPSSASPRTDSPLKPVFEVASLAQALAEVQRAGGFVTDRTFRIDGSTRHDVVDPDGNVIQLRD
jgi:predicted enzyme related to lactoylglutathione lyase